FDVIAGDNVVNAPEKASGVSVSGTAEAGATVTVSWGAQVRTAVADAAGKWVLPAPFDAQSIPGDGDAIISAVVQDLAGNNSAPANAAIKVITAPATLTLATGNEEINA